MLEQTGEHLEAATVILYWYVFRLLASNTAEVSQNLKSRIVLRHLSSKALSVASF